MTKIGRAGEDRPATCIATIVNSDLFGVEALKAGSGNIKRPYIGYGVEKYVNYLVSFEV